MDLFKKMDFKEKFDFILMADVFEHIPETDLVDFVSRVSFLQEAGGIVYILTPNPTFCGPACETELFHDGGKLDHFGHYKHYHPSEITRLFSEHNYEKIIESYEEGILKNYFKRYVFSISIRDRKYSKNIFYKMISPIFIWIPQIAFNIIEKIVYHNEWKNKNNDIKSMSYVVVFKKLK